jgi:hypothetical protein
LVGKSGTISTDTIRGVTCFDTPAASVSLDAYASPAAHLDTFIIERGADSFVVSAVAGAFWWALA